MGPLRHPVAFRALPSAIIAIIASALIAGAAAAQVVINEILPNPTGDDVGTERIEIYNAGATPVDMTGWAIDDAATIDNSTSVVASPRISTPRCALVAR